MATSLSLSNFVSFLFPSKTPTPPKLSPTQVSIPPSSSPTQFQTQTLNSRDGLVPMVASDDHSSSNLSSVICPSLAYSNTLYAERPFRVQLIPDDDESDEMLVARFRREVMRAGIIKEARRRMFHENTQERKKRKARDAAKGNRRRRPFQRFPEKDEEDVKEARKNDEVEDNWELPPGMDIYD